MVYFEFRLKLYPRLANLQCLCTCYRQHCAQRKAAGI